ncbi:MAG: hypothetical protein LBT40_13620 [Deltaproteobacteria bacterium]|jgi:hypothetical protein|nr:hypothetical protein [Deltaproteobacteria bacterium]
MYLEKAELFRGRVYNMTGEDRIVPVYACKVPGADKLVMQERCQVPKKRPDFCRKVIARRRDDWQGAVSSLMLFLPNSEE